VTQPPCGRHRSRRKGSRENLACTTTADCPGGTAFPTPGQPTPTRACDGDCTGDRAVAVDDLVAMVNIALGGTEVSTCPAGDANRDGSIAIDDLLVAVGHALNGCPP